LQVIERSCDLAMFGSADVGELDRNIDEW